MNKLKEKMIQLAGRQVKHLAETEMQTWPPNCTGIFFQPERPRQEHPPEVPHK